MKGFDSGLTTMNCDISQGFALGPFLFLLYMNDLNQAIKVFKLITLLMTLIFYVWVTLIKKLKKLVNADLKHVVNWLNANKIPLNIKKTEMVIFKSKQKNLKIKIYGKRLSNWS